MSTGKNENYRFDQFAFKANIYLLRKNKLQKKLSKLRVKTKRCQVQAKSLINTSQQNRKSWKYLLLKVSMQIKAIEKQLRSLGKKSSDIQNEIEILINQIQKLQCQIEKACADKIVLQRSIASVKDQKHEEMRITCIKRKICGERQRVIRNCDTMLLKLYIDSTKLGKGIEHKISERDKLQASYNEMGQKQSQYDEDTKIATTKLTLIANKVTRLQEQHYKSKSADVQISMATRLWDKASNYERIATTVDLVLKRSGLFLSDSSTLREFVNLLHQTGPEESLQPLFWKVTDQQPPSKMFASIASWTVEVNQLADKGISKNPSTDWCIKPMPRKSTTQMKLLNTKNLWNASHFTAASVSPYVPQSKNIEETDPKNIIVRRPTLENFTVPSRH